MHKTLCIAYIKINTIHLHHQSNLIKKNHENQIISLIRNLLVQAQTVVKTSLLKTQEVSQEKLSIKQVMKPFLMSTF
jgi:hypothetical protein